MKQKRKVKSLISPKSDGSVWLATLLFLLGGILVFGAVALFTSSVGVVSAEDDGYNLEYENGIEDKVEVLLNLKFAHSGGNLTVNKMFLSGNTFYMEGNAGITVDGTVASIANNKYINYLGGENRGDGFMNVASDNITVIGGSNDQVYQGNDNAALLGGIGNLISNGNNSVAPTMLGGQTNTIGTNQIGNAIVGGSNNSISNSGQYDFIIGGNNNQIKGDNVIVGGANVNVDERSNLFAFNGEDTTFTPQSLNAFYLNLKHGLGLNKAAVNEGVDSKGAVSFGVINILGTSCDSDDVGVQGTWEGCLVGCTKASLNSGHRWEMIDHGDRCETKCKTQSNDRCIVNPIEPPKPSDYPSYCTTEGVDTTNATQCAANRLGVYENVVFETYLIDSDQECPENIENKCVFRCNKDYHLTGGVAGSTNNRKCYKDCDWDGKKIPHNTAVTGYNINSVNCSNYPYIFPEKTAIINKPTSYYATTWNSASQMWKATRGDNANQGHSYETCTNYDHQKTLVCNNGTLYLAKSDNKTPSGTPADGVKGSKYIYTGCTLNGFTCSTIEGYYNLTQSFINSIDQNVKYAEYDRSILSNRSHNTSGDRGVYELCVDFTASPTNNSVCNRGNPSTTYHYKLVKCQDHYTTGTTDLSVSPYKCMKQCSLIGRDGTSVHRYNHNTTMTGYRHKSEECRIDGKGSCDAATITCNDGQWKMGSNKDGTVNNTKYLYDDCYLEPYVCPDNFDVKRSSDYKPANGRYNNCDPYASDNGSKFKCKAGSRQYDLVGCNPYPGYHTENNLWCISDYEETECKGNPDNSEFDYATDEWTWRGNSYNDSNGRRYHTYGNGCGWHCVGGYHRDGSSCASNHEERSCDSVATKPSGSHWVRSMQSREYVGGVWESWTPECRRECDDGLCYNGTACVSDPDQCITKVYCSCDSAPAYSSCTPYAVMNEGEDCEYTCLYGSDGAGGCLPPTKASCEGCPNGEVIAHNGECVSYSTNSSCSCNNYKRVSTCNDGDWIGGDPYEYASCSAPTGCGGGGAMCTGDGPGANTRASEATPSSNKDWQYVSDTTATLSACQWSCKNDNYERIGNNMYCTEVGNKSCTEKTIDGYTVPAMQDGGSKTVTRTKASGGCTLSCSATFSCSNTEVTKESESCDCGDSCTVTPTNGATYNNASCVKHNCGNMAENTCSIGGSVKNQDSSDLEMYKWDCDRGSEVKHCTYCKSVSTCEDIGLSSSPTGTCYDTVRPNCVPRQACYKNRACTCEEQGGYNSDAECNAAVGHTGVGTACYTNDDICFFYQENVNGACDEDNQRCLAGRYEYLGAGYNIVRWKCNGLGNGSTAECEYFANCASRGLGYDGCAVNTSNNSAVVNGRCTYYEEDFGYGYPCWATECCMGNGYTVTVGGKQYYIWDNFYGSG